MSHQVPKDQDGDWHSQQPGYPLAYLSASTLLLATRNDAQVTPAATVKSDAILTEAPVLWHRHCANLQTHVAGMNAHRMKLVFVVRYRF